MSSNMFTKLNSVVENSVRILLSITQPNDLNDDFINKYKELNKQKINNHSEQYIIRAIRNLYPNLAGHDSENKIFRIVHQFDTKIYNNDNEIIII